MRLPRWDELIPEQREVRDHPLDQPLFVAGPPGSGKTVLAIQRARQLLDSRRSVTVVTYNRMLRRLATLLEGNVQTRTMHSFIVADYQSRTGKEPPVLPWDTYRFDWRSILTTLQGHPRSNPTQHHLIVDEGQGLPEDFFRYARRHVAMGLTVFADDDQAEDACWSSLEQIKSAANLPDPVILCHNHRNTPEIAAVAEHFHSGRLPAATIRRPSMGSVPRLIRSLSTAATAEWIARWLQNRGGRIGVVVERNDTGEAIHRELQSQLPSWVHRVSIYTSKRNNEDSIELLAPGVTIVNKRSVKGQEFESVFILELERFIPCIDAPMRRAMYMMCTRARDHLFLVYGPGPLSAAARVALPLQHLEEA